MECELKELAAGPIKKIRVSPTVIRADVKLKTRSKPTLIEVYDYRIEAVVVQIHGPSETKYDPVGSTNHYWLETKAKVTYE